jgi:GTPase SAR1 family protein
VTTPISVQDRVLNDAQLVLAGERSSGKSSLLENLTGLPVPIATGQGTRFPIEFKMIKDINKYEIRSKIIPNGMFTNLNPKKLQEFNNKELTLPMMSIDFVELLREVSRLR